MADSDSLARTSRIFLQALISSPFINDSRIKHIHRIACERGGYSPDSWTNFLHHVAEQLLIVDMALKSVQNPLTGEVFWALTNINGDDIAEMATDLTFAEVSFFKHMVEQIMVTEDETFEVSSMKCLADCTRLKHPIAKKEAQRLLDSWVEQGWLQLNNGRYSLGLRSLMELESYLKAEFRDYVAECFFCKKIATIQVEHCSTEGCNLRGHAICCERYYTRRAEKQCPECNSPWRPVAATPSTVSASGPVRSQRQRRQDDRDGDEEDEIIGESQAVDYAETRRSKRAKPLPSKFVKDENGDDEDGGSDAEGSQHANRTDASNDEDAGPSRRDPMAYRNYGSRPSRRIDNSQR
ncbi:Nse1 non-SMC component of SMC5-6 complex-domain-containing protein [Polychytrium aggregatum]|uniref:Nse1 non-SMC component of SMC5-6 complex-domain-containing protein n=1 Tax=Polychytrium aggregatum TaxID=110093 RepID=UPI0022FE857A|nr:Nse1 non-SMC component of SMC5-6 complex-domain-containing protein [Polychytrium aggregatum]KAI9206342.1 Nse1 non-SMC component of SMC5-6 complex-domain-containing protein [Polychytrium aggregatum]